MATFQELSDKEWIVTNGIGGYASSSIIGANTRRYHGLLVAAFNPPTDRRVLVSKVEEKMKVNGDTFEVSSNAYPGVIHPSGYRFLDNFERKPLPKATFLFSHIRLTKTVFMVYGSNTTVVEYQNESEQTIELSLNPLLVNRDYHSLFRADDYFNYYFEQNGDTIRIYPHDGASPLFVHFSKGTFNHHAAWYRNFEYAKEAYRGLEFREDAKSIGEITLQLESNEKIYLILTTEESMTQADPNALKLAEIERQDALRLIHENPFIQDLVVSGDQFLVHRQSSDSQTILAGYHWFTDWGRDTMIAMRGLTIATGKQDISKSIIRTFLQYLDRGMIPNRFPDTGEAPEYNTIDATLWLFVVLYEYFKKFQDKAFIVEVFPKLTEILAAHRQGTRYNIHVMEEGLLYGGANLSQLTWMDAKVGDYVVTPRRGCPVEINALWYNALCIYTEFGELLSEDMKAEKARIKQFVKTFRVHFINEKGYLNDVIIPNVYKDDTIRPNQIYAVSLPFSPLTQKVAKSVFNTVGQHLYTDLGLRSLSKDYPDFKPIYKGDQWHRDSAYHQGTVWGFLWGEYALAYLTVNKFSKKAKEEILKKSATLKSHFYNESCLYGISEIFDGATPSEGRGCIQQAWSIGMLLRVLLKL